MTITKRLALTMTALLLLALSASASAAGPSFDCATQAKNKPLAQLICSDPRLQAIDLAFARAYHSLRLALPTAKKSAEPAAAAGQSENPFAQWAKPEALGIDYANSKTHVTFEGGTFWYDGVGPLLNSNIYI